MKIKMNTQPRICPDCGTREALKSMGISADEQEKIIRTIHQHTVK